MRLAALVLFIFTCAAAFSQQITAIWSHPRILLGEQSKLTIRISPVKDSVPYKPWSYEIPATLLSDSSNIGADGILEIVSEFSDTMTGKNGNRAWTGIYTVTAWDTGIYRVNPIIVPVGDTSLTIQPENLRVTFVKQKIGDEIFEFSDDVPEDPWYYLKKYWWISLIIVPLVVLFFLRRRFRVRKRFRQLSLKDRTLLAIDGLEKQAYWKKQQFVAHYSEYSYILRSFLSSRYGLSLMERTTTEAIADLRKRGLDNVTLDRIRELLDDSDLVKFAQNLPTEAFILETFERLRKLVIELSPLEVANE